MIGDEWARRSAAEWHSGQGSALYLLACSGATRDTRHDVEELRDEIDHAAGAGGLTGAGRRELADLAAYVTAAGARGPVTGWADLAWPTAEDPWVASYTAAGAVLHADGWALTGSTHPDTDWLTLTDTWSATLTRHGQRAATVRGPAGGPAAWAGVEHQWWADVDPGLARGFVHAARRAGTSTRTALAGLAHVEVLHLDELTASPVTALFLYEGFRDWVELHDPDQAEVLTVGGAVEQAQLMAGYAPVVDAAAALGLAEDPAGRDRPGVLEYEAINPVGQWLAHQVATRAGGPNAQGQPATPVEVATHTRAQTLNFITATTTPPRRRAAPATPTTTTAADSAVRPRPARGARL